MRLVSGASSCPSSSTDIFLQINTLLDLRQKHAGNQDAEFGRQQANTTMVFTIVTIIFVSGGERTAVYSIETLTWHTSSLSRSWRRSLR